MTPLLFTLGGTASLIHVMAWFQLSQLDTGSMFVALGGMGVGSFVFSRIVSKRDHPLRVYALLEIGIAVSGLLVLFGFFYAGTFCAGLLIGGTLAVSSRLSANLAGGVVGCLVAGFYLLPVYDVAVAIYVAAAINLLVALAAGIGGRSKNCLDNFSSVPQFPAAALSGVAMVGTLAVWMRLLPLSVGETTYTFTIIVGVFLLGMALGSGLGSRLDLGICQMLAAGGIVWSAYILIQVLPYWPIDPALTRSPRFDFQLNLFSLVWPVLPSAFFWGASFGRMTGGMFAAGVFGAMMAAAGFSMGTRHTLQAVVGVSVVAAILNFKGGRARLIAGLAGVVLIFSVPPTPGSVIAYGRSLARTLSNIDSVTRDYVVPNILYADEGKSSSIAVSETSTGTRSLHVNGRIEASTAHQDMRLQRMLGHLPGLFHPRPRSVLIVGFGAGVTAGTFVNHPSVERIVICEIEPLLPGAAAKYFADQNDNVLDDPRVEIVYKDARRCLRETEEKFDVITSHPTRPWLHGAALYTREYFELVRGHLSEGGVVAQPVSFHHASMDVVKSQLATFSEVFPGGTLWSNDVSGKGYDLVLLGMDSTAAINAGEIEQRLARRDHANVVRSLEEVGFASAVDLLATHDGRGSDLGPWLTNAEINRDDNLRLQYLAGMSLNRAEQIPIYDSILEHRRPREELFAGSPQMLEELSHAIDRRRPRRLINAQAASIAKVLAAGPPRRISLSWVIGDDEALQYATALREAITAGGWQIDRSRQSEFTERVAGLLIFVGVDPPPTEANELFQALRAAGLTVEGNVDSTGDSNRIVLVVGAHQ